jgi:hypothetical protein
MLSLKQTVEAVIERIEPYGVFLRHGDSVILVMLPDIAITREEVRIAMQNFVISQTVTVTICRYNEDKSQYIGSMYSDIQWGD